MSQSFMELDTCDQEYTEKIVDCFQPNFSVYTSLGANRETLKKTVSPLSKAMATQTKHSAWASHREARKLESSSTCAAANKFVAQEGPSKDEAF